MSVVPRFRDPRKIVGFDAISLSDLRLESRITGIQIFVTRFRKSLLSRFIVVCCDHSATFVLTYYDLPSIYIFGFSLSLSNNLFFFLIHQQDSPWQALNRPTTSRRRWRRCQSMANVTSMPLAIHHPTESTLKPTRLSKRALLHQQRMQARHPHLRPRLLWPRSLSLPSLSLLLDPRPQRRTRSRPLPHPSPQQTKSQSQSPSPSQPQALLPTISTASLPPKSQTPGRKKKNPQSHSPRTPQIPLPNKLRIPLQCQSRATSHLI
jgi:hypothetical protein